MKARGVDTTIMGVFTTDAESGNLIYYPSPEFL
jgi:hypothetical protein